MKKETYIKYTKRLIDIILSIIFIIIFMPIYLIVYILVLIKLGYPVIYKQKRIGINNEVFVMYKFRSMLNTKNKNGELLPDSIRLTKLGKILRKTSLDELPQFFNVLIGNMSIIGPRPCILKDAIFFDKYSKKRLLVKPGITGLAQVSGRNGLDWGQKIEKDLEYIKNISFFLDLKILFKTVLVVIERKDIASKGKETHELLFEYLLRKNKITKEECEEKLKTLKLMD